MVNSLIFIHGWASSPKIWFKQKEYFGKSYKVILPDISIASNIKEASDIAGESVSAEENFVLIGWSLGWLVVLELLKNLSAGSRLKSKISSMPKGLVSVNSTPKFVDDGYLGAGPKNGHLLKVIKDARRFPQKAAEDFYKAMLSDKGAEMFARFNAEESRGLVNYNNLVCGLKILKDSDYREFIKEINIPALLIAGLRDNICPEEASGFMQQRIKGSKLQILDSGHMPFFTKEKEFNASIDNFVKGL